MSTKKQSNIVPIMIAATAVLAGAGAYAFSETKSGKSVKKAIGKYSSKAKIDLLKNLKSVEGVTEKGYHTAVKALVTKYKDVIDEKEVKSIEKELKGYWKDIKSHAVKLAKQIPKVKKVAKKAVSKKKSK